MVGVLKPGLEPIAGYRLVRYLGRGGFGEVWETEAPGGLAKAIKIAPMDHTDPNLSCRELEGLRKMRSIRHPYLLSIERFEVVENSLIIVMELADQNLAERFEECVATGRSGIPRDELLLYMREAAEVLDLMGNQHSLQHLDVKPENLFLCGGHVKVADFGLVQPRNTSMSQTTLAISPPYAPPELFDGRVEPTADQYSLAVTYQEMLTGRRPYDAPDVRGLIMQHLRGRPDISPAPPADRPILSRALSREASGRFDSCAAFVDALRHATEFGQPTINPVQPADRVCRFEETTSRIRPVRLIEEPARALVTRPSRTRRPAAERTKETTAPFARGTTTSTREKMDTSESDRARSTFVAFLPIEIFAHKLRGFIDALEADIVACGEEKTVLRLGPRGWFGRRGASSVFLEIETFTRNPHQGFRVVDAVVYRTRREVDAPDWIRRAMLLIQCLKAYLMATDTKAPPLLQSEREIRAALLT